MKKILFFLILACLVLGVSSCKRSDVDDPSIDGPAGYNVLLEGSASPAVLFVDGIVIHSSQINVRVTDSKGNPLANRTILFEQYDANTTQIAWGYFENALATMQKLTDNAGRVTATFYGPLNFLGTQMFIRALMVIDGRSTGFNLPQDMIPLTLSRPNYQNFGPDVTITAPAENATVSGSVEISARAIDEGGIAQVYCYIDGKSIGSLPGSTTSDTYSFTWDSTQYTNGTHQIKVIAYDSEGKSGMDQLDVNVAGNNLSPEVNITTPAPGAFLTGTADITALATDADGIDKVDCYIDGSLIDSLPGSTTSDTYSFSWDTTQYSNGRHEIKVVATDNAGMTGSDIIYVNVTNADSPPEVTIVYPVSGNITLPSGVTILTIKANASDDKAIDRVELYVNDVFVHRMAESESLYQYKWTVPASGTYSFFAIAYDSSNQMAKSASVTVTITLTP